MPAGWRGEALAWRLQTSTKPEDGKPSGSLNGKGGLAAFREADVRSEEAVRGLLRFAPRRRLAG